MNKRRVPWLVSLWLLAAASPLIAQQSKPAQSTKQPNIVIIWAMTSVRPTSAPTRWD